MKRFTGCRLALCMLLFLLGLSSCKKEDPNPELIDPIFVDLGKRSTDSQKAFDEQIKKQADLRDSIQRAEPNSLQLKNAQLDFKKSKNLSADLEQKAHFYQIRAKRRLFVDRIAYKAAFAKGEAWPDPHEYSEYQVNMRLQESPRNWNARVPKLQSRLVSSAPKVEKGKEKSGGPEE